MALMVDGQIIANVANLVEVEIKNEQENAIVQLQPMVVKIVLVPQETQNHATLKNAQVRYCIINYLIKGIKKMVSYQLSLHNRVKANHSPRLTFLCLNYFS